MVANLAKGMLKWKSRTEFDTAANCSFYENLKALPPLASHKKLTRGAIFNSTKYELLQVKEDILSIYDVVNKDINEERNQMQQIEFQLKKSLKKVEHNYKKVLKQRASTSGINGNDCLLSNAEKKLVVLDGELARVDAMVEDIINIFIALNDKLPKKAQLLKNDSINEAHYPLLFDFLRKACPEAIVSATEIIVQEDNLNSSPSEEGELLIESTDNIDGGRELRNNTPDSHSKDDGDIPKYQKFLPPTFSKRSGPSIVTNFENVSADGLTYTKHCLKDTAPLT
ncbi:hypothetical protein SEUBUCD646_0E00750 [Saccharomyces eubayanus]|uniref:VAB2-like protein n=1 Tax=Saccharomyces eubayanus TaxID=1080349 RepID=A0ABN8VN97_SACEU|nr:hypothetical protein SEUBUCD650_0E00790 [Saccharomyces eubayanus]CAI1974909.1 hypothetical protein SEUBUCD646_0E00750 [Saccharomyces eubayanus]